MKKPFLLVWLVLLAVFALLPAAPVSAQNLYDTWIAFVGSDGNVYLVRTDGTQRTPITTDARPGYQNDQTPEGSIEYFRPQWSPNGKMLAFMRQTAHIEPSDQSRKTAETIVVYDMLNKTQRGVLDGFPVFAWKPNSDGFVYHGMTNQFGPGGWQQPVTGIFQFNLDSGESAPLVNPPGKLPLFSPAYSANGRYLTFNMPPYTEGMGYFGYYDFQEGVFRSWETPEQEVGHHSWPADASFIIFDKNTYAVQPENRIWRADPLFQNATAISPERGSNFAFYWPEVSPDGRLVAALGVTFNQPLVSYSLWVMNSDGSEPHEVVSMEEPAQIFMFSWSPDSRKLLVPAGQWEQQTIYLVDAGSDSKTPIAEGHDPAWQPVAVEVEPILQATAEPALSATPNIAPTVDFVLPTAPSETLTPTPVAADRGLPGFSLGLTSMLLIGGGCLVVIVVIVLVMVFLVLPGRKKP